MTNNFEEIMSEHSDKQLAEILTSGRKDYQERAIEVARVEFEKRGLKLEDFPINIDSPKEITINDNETQSSLSLTYKILTLLLPFIVAVLFQIQFQSTAPPLTYLNIPFSIIIQLLTHSLLKQKKLDKIALEFKLWCYYSWFLILGLIIFGFIVGFIMGIAAR